MPSALSFHGLSHTHAPVALHSPFRLQSRADVHLAAAPIVAVTARRRRLTLYIGKYELEKGPRTQIPCSVVYEVFPRYFGSAVPSLRLKFNLKEIKTIINKYDKFILRLKFIEARNGKRNDAPVS